MNLKLRAIRIPTPDGGESIGCFPGMLNNRDAQQLDNVKMSFYTEQVIPVIAISAPAFLNPSSLN
jgi:hypothetical protein